MRFTEARTDRGIRVMRGKSFAQVALVFVLAAVLFAALFSPLPKAHALNTAQADTSTAGSCDRACLYGFVDQYMAALVAKDPARVPWAAHVKFTENNVELPVGYGLWGTISGRGADDARAADPQAGQVAYFGVIDERGTKSFFGLRLKVDDGKISEVETIVDRKGYGPGPFGNPETMQPLPVLLADVPAEARRPRARMISMANGYFSTLELNDGTVVHGIYRRLQPARERRVDRERSASGIGAGSESESFGVRENFLRARDSSWATIAGMTSCARGVFPWLTKKRAWCSRAGSSITPASSKIHDDRRRGARIAAEIAALILFDGDVQDSGRQDPPRRGGIYHRAVPHAVAVVSPARLAFLHERRRRRLRPWLTFRISPR